MLYFQSESIVDKVNGANALYLTMKNVGTKHILLFLNYVLDKVNNLNIEFQSEHFRLHVLHSMVYSEYKNILGCFIKEEAINTSKICNIDPTNKQLKDLY